VATAITLLGCSSVTDDPPDPSAAARCYDKASLTSAEICERLGDACTEGNAAPSLSDAITVVPDEAAMPSGVASQTAHNNLDIVWHRGRLFFAFRTAPSHFADDQVVMYVVSTADQQSWQLETTIALEKDLREPRFLPLGDKLFLYFARLGPITLTFKPEATMVSEQIDGCVWSDAEEIDPVGEPGFIPWRAREVDGVGYLIGYSGGEEIYEVADSNIDVHWLRTSDGRSFEPAVGDDSVVLSGGVSETDYALRNDGSLVAVTRNEAGDEDGFGAKICRAEADALDDWSCAPDPRKYDSPLVFAHKSEIYLVGRRQVANDGLFDLGMDELSAEDQLLEYQAEYWNTPKRCALWRVDGDALSVEHVLDLPSNGDTCFASVVPLNGEQYLLYNYTSPLDDLELPWNDGQFGPTYIYRTTLTLP